MTRDDIIRMAREAGFDLFLFFTLAYEAGAKDEREACAKLAASKASVGDASNYPTYIAAAIRARGNT